MAALSHTSVHREIRARALVSVNDLLGVAHNNNGGGPADIYPPPPADKAHALCSSVRGQSPAHAPVTLN